MNAHFGRAEAARLRYQESMASEPKRNFFQSLRDRITESKENFAPREIAENGKKYLWVLVVLAVAGGAFAYFRSGRTITPPAINLQGDAYLEIPLLGLGLAFLFLFSLLETTARHDPLLLDFLAAWGTVAILVAGELYGHDAPIFWFFLGMAFLGMVIGTFFNPIQETESKWWDRIDTTHWYVAGIALIFIYMMNSETIPYPSYIPIVVPIIVAAIGIGKEFFRETVFSLIAFAVGIVPAVTQSMTWIAIGFAVTFFLAAIGAKQGWTQARGTTHSISIGNLNLEFVMAWDLVLFYLIELVLIGFAIYQNYAVFTIG
jgi:hypothetical protein